MAAEFGASGWGYLAGLRHNPGKFPAVFHQRISAIADAEAHVETRKGLVDHSTAAAIRAGANFSARMFIGESD